MAMRLLEKIICQRKERDGNYKIYLIVVVWNETGHDIRKNLINPKSEHSNPECRLFNLQLLKNMDFKDSV